MRNKSNPVRLPVILLFLISEVAMMTIEKKVYILLSSEKLEFNSHIQNAKGLILARVREEMIKEKE